MERILTTFILMVVLIFIAPLMAALFGAFSGWIIGWFFADVILGFLARIGVNTVGLEMWQVGMSLGFIGGFLSTSISKRD